MKVCLLCGQEFLPMLSFSQLFSWHTGESNRLCNKCLKRFCKLTGSFCRFCHKELAKSGICQDCLYWQQHYGTNLLPNLAIYRYNAAVHDLMVRYKRYGDYCLREVLQELCVPQVHKLTADFYVPIPTSPEHQSKRQFDTINAIYGELLPLTFLLTKKAKTGAQGEKNRSERLASEQSFAVSEQVLGEVELTNKKIVLLDDIYTTGRTLYHACDAIRNYEPTIKITSFTLFR